MGRNLYVVVVSDRIADQKKAILRTCSGRSRSRTVLANKAEMAMRFLRRSLLRASSLVALLILAGCTSFSRTPYSPADASSARVLDLRDLRKYADEPASSFLNEARVRSVLAGGARSYLALSGGGADGAYGAGVLNGWTAAGTRPEFSVVSGVSTGALIAPFAFLGPAYDATLREIYTSGIAESLVDQSNILGVVFGSGQCASTRAHRPICRSEHARGYRRRVHKGP